MIRFIYVYLCVVIVRKSVYDLQSGISRRVVRLKSMDLFKAAMDV